MAAATTLKLDWWKLSMVMQERLFLRIMAAAYAQGFSAACYSLPVAVVQRFGAAGHSLRRAMPVFLFAGEELNVATVGEWRRYGAEQQAFVFSPFVLEKTKTKQFYDFPFAYLMPLLRWELQRGVLWSAADARRVGGAAAAANPASKTLLVAFAETLRDLADRALAGRLRPLPKAAFHQTFHFSAGPGQATTRAAFIKNVEAALAEIHRGQLTKLVLSRVAALELKRRRGAQLAAAGELDTAAIVQRTARAFIRAMNAAEQANAFVALVTAKHSGTWFTTSPEPLVIQTQEEFATVSLAGTQVLPVDLNTRQRNPMHLPRHIAWHDKDIMEQALVSRYIVDCFKTLRLRQYVESGPRTVRHDKLLHLETRFTVSLKQTYGHDLALDMLALLHPTAAVAGTPLAAALKGLEKLEDHTRRYYTGFLGPLHLVGNTALYVNLRCVEITAQHVWAYAGTGIVEASIPALEWEESENKLDGMRKYFTI